MPTTSCTAAGIGLALLLIFAAPCPAQTPDPNESILQLLKARDPDLAHAGVEKIKLLLGRSASRGTIDWVRQQWVPALIKAEHHEQAADLAQRAVLARSNSPAVVEELIRLRVWALLSAKKPKEALAGAKGLFNVSTMGGSAGAIQLAALALQAGHPQDQAISRRFKLEQLAEGVEPGKRPMFKDITAEAEPYLSWVKQFGEKRFAELTMRGNLYLLADRPKEARDAFEKAYRIASDEELATATESLARVMKAEDGTIARAHAFVISLRPKE